MAWRIALFLASFLVLCGATVLVPGVDLASGGLFYAPGHGFFLADSLPIRLIRAAMPYLVGAIIVAGLVLIALQHWRAGVFLLLALALGPGLVVNVIFKDHWGRARPAQIAEFGGTARFTRPFVPSDQCASNCSFPAGDPSNGFVLVAAGMLIAAPRRRRAAIAGALGLGAVIGVARMAQGGHFFSDVLASGYLVFATSWALHRSIIVADGLPALARRLAHPSPGLQRLAGGTALAIAAFAASYLWVDRPLAVYFADAGPRVIAVFSIITKFGVSTGYLVIAALIALGFVLRASGTADQAERPRLIDRAWRAAFVFVAVAGPGLFGDILKPVFGRARPQLFLGDGTFGFTWHGARAVDWSFPSGHSITIVALALTLGLIERRLLPLLVAAALLVMASRVVLDQHYLSDAVAGAYIGWVGAWATSLVFRRVLSDSP
jgi:lipid A 4'-phosphatase